MRSPLTLLVDSWMLVRQNFPLYIGILIVPTALSFVAAIFMPPADTGVVNVTDWTVYLVLLALSTIVSIFMSIALILAMANPAITTKQAYKLAMPLFWRYIGLTVVVSILVMVGFLLLIVPGILLMVWFTFATFILVLEHATIKESLQQSRERVRGRWWAVFGRVIAMSLIAMVVSMIFGIIVALVPNQLVQELAVSLLSLILAPLFVGYIYLMYQDVTKDQVRDAMTENGIDQ